MERQHSTVQNPENQSDSTAASADKRTDSTLTRQPVHVSADSDRSENLSSLLANSPRQQRLVQLIAIAGRSKTSFDLTPVLQREETLPAKIIRILSNRRIEVTEAGAEELARQLEEAEPNTLVPIPGHHRALKKNRADGVSSVAYRPPTSAAGMRLDGAPGAATEAEATMLTPGREVYTGFEVSAGATITAARLASVGSRTSMGSVFGASASATSGIDQAEWLHLIAHSLGGADSTANAEAGAHALNTAMIPFERLAAAIAATGRTVEYQVSFFCESQGDINFVTGVEIGISVHGSSWEYVSLHSAPSHMEGNWINPHVFKGIEEFAKTMKTSILAADSSAAAPTAVAAPAPAPASGGAGAAAGASPDLPDV